MVLVCLLVGFFILRRRRVAYNDPGQRLVRIGEAEDELGRWADEHRVYITPELEQKLRSASYSPWYDPDEIPADVWQRQHGIGHYELRRLRELYARCVDIPHSLHRATG